MRRVVIGGLVGIVVALAVLALIGGILGWVGWEIGHLGGARNPAEGAGFLLAFLGFPVGALAFLIGVVVGFVNREKT